MLNQSKVDTEAKYALIVRDESQELNRFVSEQLPQLKNHYTPRNHEYRNGAILGAGIRDGQSIRIHQGISEGAEIEQIG